MLLAVLQAVDPFLSWEGWTFVGTCAQVASLLALISAVWGYFLRRRMVPLVLLQWVVVGRQHWDGQWWHVLEVRNLGSGVAHVFQFEIFGAYPHQGIASALPAMLGSGTAHRILLTAPELQACWVRTITRSPTDETLLTVSWAPLMINGNLAEKWRKARAAWLGASRLARHRERRRCGLVAPDGILSDTFRVSRASVDSENPRLMEAAGAVADTPVAILSGMPFAFDLPYVGPPPGSPSASTAASS